MKNLPFFLNTNVDAFLFIYKGNSFFSPGSFINVPLSAEHEYPFSRVSEKEKTGSEHLQKCRFRSLLILLILIISLIQLIKKNSNIFLNINTYHVYFKNQLFARNF